MKKAAIPSGAAGIAAASRRKFWDDAPQLTIIIVYFDRLPRGKPVLPQTVSTRAPHAAARRLVPTAAHRILLWLLATGTLSAPALAQTTADPATLAPVTVQGSVQASDTLGDEYVATRSRAATKSNTALIDTPQTINVVTRSEMDRQGSNSVAQALRFTPGVNAQYGDTDVRLDWLTVRGFTPQRYLDGLILPFGVRGYAQPRIEAYGLERIEVLKGPSSGLYGQGAPGGILTMTSKRPTEERINEINLQTGSHGRAQAGFDFSGAVDQEGRLLYRLTGMGLDTDTQYDYVDDKRVFIAPSFTWKLSADTQFNLSAQYQEIESHGGGGAPVLPYIGTGEASSQGRIPRDRYVGDPDFDRFTNRQTLFGYTLDHRVNDVWQLRQTARVSEVNARTRRVQIGLMATETQAVRYAWAFPETARAFQIDNQANAEFAVGATRHHLTLGLDYLRERSRFTESQLDILRNGSGGFALFDLYDPDYGNLDIRTPADALVINQRREQLGLYAQDRIEFGRLSVTLAGRQDWTSTRTDTRRVGGTDTDLDTHASRFTGRVAAAYRYDNGLAPYISYATSFQPVAGTTRDGNPLRPTTGTQYEAGLKFQPPGSDSLYTASLFQIVQNNVSAPDPLNTSYSVQTGQVRIQGLELEAKARLARGLDLTASYAYSDSEITKTNRGDTTGQVGNQMIFVPRHQAALWLDYTLQQGPLAGLGMGAGVRYRGTLYGDLNNTHLLKPVTLVDATVRYDLGRMAQSLRGADVSVSVSNLFDREYVVNCPGPTACYWGSERTVLANLRYRW
ncbi:TonB-dependent siderophore receptor [Bordetella genomosp. 1]|uniref:TonB-dependent siderophore receptor n=1 Tax=Bordetella genomosp. 1 TaxID=1395607 RepID=A0A261RW52_9BORD|nr:TonB-dependent siderophore receptor [Bordetella genomosp. 1]